MSPDQVALQFSGQREDLDRLLRPASVAVNRTANGNHEGR